MRTMTKTLSLGAVAALLLAPAAAAHADNAGPPEHGTASHSSAGSGWDEVNAENPLALSSSGTQEVQASTGCYANAVTRSRSHARSGVIVTSRNLTTSSRCRDINVRHTLGSENRVEARVCFLPSSGGRTCQSSWTDITGGWRVVASDVITGTAYEVQTRVRSFEPPPTDPPMDPDTYPWRVHYAS